MTSVIRPVAGAPGDMCGRHELPRSPGGCPKCNKAEGLNLRPFNGAEIIEKVPGNQAGEWGVVVWYRDEYVAFWANDLTRTYWGQGHYFRPENQSEVAMWKARSAALDRAKKLAGR